VIPLVAASERGPAQTDWYVKASMRCTVGVAGPVQTEVLLGRGVTKHMIS
jgi:hypothetical protein